MIKHTDGWEYWGTIFPIGARIRFQVVGGHQSGEGPIIQHNGLYNEASSIEIRDYNTPVINGVRVPIALSDIESGKVIVEILSMPNEGVY